MNMQRGESIHSSISEHVCEEIILMRIANINQELTAEQALGQAPYYYCFV